MFCTLTDMEDPGELKFSDDEFSGGGEADLVVLHHLTHHDPATSMVTFVLRHLPSTTFSAATSILFLFLAQQTTANDKLFGIKLK